MTPSPGTGPELELCMFVPVTGGVADLVVDKRDSVHPFRADGCPHIRKGITVADDKGKAISSFMTEDRSFPVPAGMADGAHISGMKQYQ